MNKLDESEYILISAIQKFAFCPRECYLVHKCEIWDENYHTATGSLFHKAVHTDGYTTRHGLRQEP